jgi:hypothetical protein
MVYTYSRSQCFYGNTAREVPVVIETLLNKERMVTYTVQETKQESWSYTRLYRTKELRTTE